MSTTGFYTFFFLSLFQNMNNFSPFTMNTTTEKKNTKLFAALDVRCEFSLSCDIKSIELRAKRNKDIRLLHLSSQKKNKNTGELMFTGSWSFSLKFLNWHMIDLHLELIRVISFLQYIPK